MASQETTDAFERAQALCDLLPETPALGWALNGVGLVRYGSANYDATHALGERIYALSSRSDEPGLRISGCNLIGMASAGRGEFEQCQHWLRQGGGGGGGGGGAGARPRGAPSAAGPGVAAG